MNILFVCTANISRSFLAEKLMKHRIAELNLTDIAVSSAGVHAYPGSAPDSKMVEFLEKSNIVYDEHQSKLLAREDAEWADHILVMESDHKKQILNLWPEVRDKVALLGSYVSMDQNESDIDDPYGLSPYHYRTAHAQISLAIEELLKRITRKNIGSAKR